MNIEYGEVSKLFSLLLGMNAPVERVFSLMNDLWMKTKVR